MNTYMRTSPIEIKEHNEQGKYVVESEAPVNDGVKFEFEVYEYTEGDYTTGGIVTVGELGVMKEVAQWYRSNRGHIRYSFEEHINE